MDIKLLSFPLLTLALIYTLFLTKIFERKDLLFWKKQK
jgi:hypothetical protein